MGVSSLWDVSADSVTPGFADTSLFCGHPEALSWRDLQFSIYLEIKGKGHFLASCEAHMQMLPLPES